MSNQNLYLAADSGGSKTEWSLIDQSGNILFRKRTNGVAAVKEGLLPVQEIVNTAKKAFENYKKPKAIYMSLGGPNTEEVKTALLSAWPDTDITVERESTGNAILLAASFFGCNACVMCGTGSVAIGDKNGKRCYSGGWGPIYGDGGSGGGMGSDALKLFLRHIDNMEDIGMLSGIFSELTTGLNIKNYADRMELKTRALNMSRRKLASLAPEIYKLAELGDPCSVKLYKTAAHEVALMAYGVSDNRTESCVMLCGGFFINKPLFLEWCEEAFSQISKGNLVYKEDFSPIIAAELTVLKNNNIELTNELFINILKNEKEI